MRFLKRKKNIAHHERILSLKGDRAYARLAHFPTQKTRKQKLALHRPRVSIGWARAPGVRASRDPGETFALARGNRGSFSMGSPHGALSAGQESRETAESWRTARGYVRETIRYTAEVLEALTASLTPASGDSSLCEEFAASQSLKTK